MTYDCIVIGLGGMGSSVLYHLAKQGIGVLGLEQFGPAHDRGSSHGETRIIRKAYFEHPDYVPLLHAAYDLWEDLEQRTGKSLLVQCGVVLSGRRDGEAVSGAVRSASEHCLPIELLDSFTARERFPRYSFPEDHTVVFEPEAGFLYVEDCVRTVLDEAVKLGAQARFHESLKSWEVRHAEVHLQTSQQTYVARQVVFAGGAWSQSLLETALPELQVLRKVQVWYPAQQVTMNDEPAFYLENRAGGFYGISTPQQGVIKIAEHTVTHDLADPNQIDRRLWETDTVRLNSIVGSFLQGVTPIPLKHAVCMYTMSPDGHFVIDRHPNYENVFVAAGFSGHGFKFASVVGKALADSVIAGKTDMPIDFLSLTRFD